MPHLALSLSMTCFMAVAATLPATGQSSDETQPTESEDLTEIVASQNISVRRGGAELLKDLYIHPKNLSRNKHKLDRFAMIRFDSEDFGKNVEAASFRIYPRDFGEHEDKAYQFRIYGVKDGDLQDETFTEKDYDPSAEDALADSQTKSMVDRRQVVMLGAFSAKEDEPVLFSSDSFLEFINADTNGTVTVVLVRQTVTGANSQFKTRTTEQPPALLLKLSNSEEADQDPEAEADEKPPTPAP